MPDHHAAVIVHEYLPVNRPAPLPMMAHEGHVCTEKVHDNL
jgi:hypothetical protein